MTIIRLFATDQKLSITLAPKLSSGDKNSVCLQVAFDGIWKEYEKSAVFYTSWDKTPYEVLLTDCKCTVPHEVLEKAGYLFIGVRGVKADGVTVKTTCVVKLKVDQGAPTGNVPADPTPDVYQQILAKLAQLEQGNVDLTGYATEKWVREGYQPKGNYLTQHQDISGKLDASKLPSAINTALAQAKASGEFDGVDGKDGYTPVKGKDYFDGKDGQPGKNGTDGKTPVKGVDYFTSADKTEMVNDVLAALPIYNGEVEDV